MRSIILKKIRNYTPWRTAGMSRSERTRKIWLYAKRVSCYHDLNEEIGWHETLFITGKKVGSMKSVISIGNQDFISIRENHCFYIDKTDFIREWWENQDSVTLITRPRRFGKILNMSRVEYFFSVKYSGLGTYFEGLNIWKNDKLRKLQEAYVSGHWGELTAFIRSIFNSTFKTNQCLERGAADGNYKGKQRIHLFGSE